MFPIEELDEMRNKPKPRHVLKARSRTTEERFHERIDIWKLYAGGWPVTREGVVAFRFPRIRHAFHWFLHNVPVHILLGIFPCKLTFKIHDWSSDRLNAVHMIETANNAHLK